MPGTILYAGAQAVWKTDGGPIPEPLIHVQGKCVCQVLINAIKTQYNRGRATERVAGGTVGSRGRALSGRESRENHVTQRALSRGLTEVREPAMSLSAGKGKPHGGKRQR